jgi:hypothetical protein
MEVSTIVKFILFVLVVLIVVQVVLYFVKVSKNPYQGQKALYNLSVPNQIVLGSTDFAWSDSPCTIRFGILIKNAPRSVSKVDCIEDTVPTSSFAPNCTDYRYKRCACTGTNCGNCSLDSSASGYLTNLVSVGDYMQFWASGYTSQNDKPYVPAILKVRTGKDGSQHFMESISLPAIPLQKWTIVTIVKEGRRFDVYYGGKLQTSKLTDYVPIPPDSVLNWSAVPNGATGWNGEIGFFMGYNKAYYSDDVLNDMQSLLNTRGIPFYVENPPLSVSLPQGCLFGNCQALPSVGPPPKSPFTTWSSTVS